MLDLDDDDAPLVQRPPLSTAAFPWDLHHAPDRAAAAVEVAQRLLGNPSPPVLAAWVGCTADGWALWALCVAGWRKLALDVATEADGSLLPDGSRRAHALALAEALAAGRGGE